MSISIMTKQERLNHAVMYALREGCFTPVPYPKRGASIQKWIRWGTMRHLHDVIRDFWSKDKEA